MCNKCDARAFDESIELANNAMLKIRPDLFYEWDFDKNDELKLDIYKVTKGSHKLVWWICSKCKSSYDSIIYNKVKQFKCPYCSGQKANHTNSLESLYPSLAKEWHPTKNGSLTPNDVTTGSGKRVWWLGKCGHEWKVGVKDRVNAYKENIYGSKCPICDGKQVLIGFNDMWTTNPELAELLVDYKDGYKYTHYSGKKVNWKCPDCGEIIYNRVINNINQKGISCPHCSDGKSFPEKVVYNLLKHLNLKFTWEKTFKWLPRKRYDFYLQDYNMIIEVHGKQHYEASGFEKMGGRSLNEEMHNDNIKEVTAIENGIDTYIKINAIKSEFTYLKEQILKSELSIFLNLNNVDWEQIHNNSLKSLMVEVNNLWDKGYNVNNIILKTKLSKTTILRFLNGNSSFKKYCEMNNKRIVVQLTRNNEYIETFNSIIEAKMKTGISHIHDVCKGYRKISGGYKWMYKEDYDKFIKSS